MRPDSVSKYKPFPKVALSDRQWPDNELSQAPIWTSVDLRDGNQALINPMSVDQKLEYFEMLVEIGFKEIEVGFPSASATEFDFIRRLVDEKRIPSDVTLQVLVQAREHLIERTFESLKGVPKAIVHLYNSTSTLQRKITFRDASREDIKAIAVEGTKIVKRLVPTLPETDVRFQYSPESFSDTELDFALEVCEAVQEIWQPTKENPMVMNLPATVEWCTPNVHADQIEWFCRNLKDRESVLISLHTHNDRGTGVAATELGLMAGADRVEGTLFGNGERTGNLDIVTVALNMNSHGIQTGLDFSNLRQIRDTYERMTELEVAPRQPYAGDLVFTAFSGSHQDAIKKGMDRMEESKYWGVPYLTIDPKDIGRNYSKDIIRINSQSGKGGMAYILQTEFGLDIPEKMKQVVGNTLANFADKKGTEIEPQEVYDAFAENFVNITAPLTLDKFHFERESEEIVTCFADLALNGENFSKEGTGNGPINALVNIIGQIVNKDFKVLDYRAHSASKGSSADSIAYLKLQNESGESFWGVGRDASIGKAGLLALVTAWNRLRLGVK